ncbi:MAG TPA: hypothetical protein VG709_06770 [Actinomycetota bacterium]|nr:hypothetical protein [Actinomycetota bacterium]
MDEDAIREALERVGAAAEPTLEVVHPGRAPAASRLGMLPGSFDPMTVAHAALAGALNRDGCDLVLLVYSARTLPKQDHGGRSAAPPLLAPEARVASLVAFARRRPWAAGAVSSHGLLVDQVEAAARAFGRPEVVLGIGSDKLLQLLDRAWYEDRDTALKRLFGVARVAYALREGDAAAVERAFGAEPRWRERVTRLALRPDVADISSRELRRRSRRDVEDMVPPEVRPFLGGA